MTFRLVTIAALAPAAQRWLRFGHRIQLHGGGSHFTRGRRPAATICRPAIGLRVLRVSGIRFLRLSS